MAALLEVLIGANVKENFVVMVNNQSILQGISGWVGEGGRTFLGKYNQGSHLAILVINH